jgi:hypothetical protein
VRSSAFLSGISHAANFGPPTEVQLLPFVTQEIMLFLELFAKFYNKTAAAFRVRKLRNLFTLALSPWA